MSDAKGTGTGFGGSKLPGHARHLQKWLDGESCGPLVAEVSLTRGCNHACVHCGFQQYGRYEKERTFLDVEKLLLFMEDFRALGGVELFFAGNGEPLLHPDFARIVAHGAGLGLAMVMSSNGALLTPELSRQALPYMDWIRFSFNGGTAPVYAKVHQCPQQEYELVCANIAAAVAVREELGLDVRLAIQFIAYKPNMDSLPDMVETFQRTGADELIVRGVFFKGGYGYGPADMEALERVRDVPGVRVRLETFTPEDKEPGWTTCRGFYFRTNLDDQGRIFACNKHLSSPCFLGDITKESFADLWTGEKAQSTLKELEHTGLTKSCFEMCQTAGDNLYLENVFKERMHER